MRKKNKLIYGVGINDADYVTQPTINGKRVWCSFYQTWQNMMARCYSTKFQNKNPAYIGCAVCEEWLTFSNFKSWMETQEWAGKELDKDILVVGNKIYSAENCVFIDKATNNFTTDNSAVRGEYPIGVILYKRYGNFQVRCCNPFNKKMEHLGYFACPNQAHQAWKKRKHELACRLADLQPDERVAAALRLRYA